MTSTMKYTVSTSTWKKPKRFTTGYNVRPVRDSAFVKHPLRACVVDSLCAFISLPQACVAVAFLGYLHTLLRLAIAVDFQYDLIALIVAIADFCLFQVPLYFGVGWQKPALLQPFVCETVCKILFFVILAPFRWVLWMSFDVKDPEISRVDEFLEKRLPDGLLCVVGQLILLGVLLAVVLHAKEMITRSRKMEEAVNKTRQKRLQTPRHVTAFPNPNLLGDSFCKYPSLKIDIERDYV